MYLDFLSNIEYTEIKKLNEYDLQWLLYLFVCSEKDKRKEMYHDTNFMRTVERKMENFTKNLNEMLYYDPEEFRKNAEYKEGERDGIKQGRKEEKTEIALKMIEKNLPNEDIMEFTGLTEKEIEELKKEK